MTKAEKVPFNPHEFAAGIVAPKDPMKAYDARQAELAQKDHPWASKHQPDTPVAEDVTTAFPPVENPDPTLPFSESLSAQPEAIRVGYEEIAKRGAALAAETVKAARAAKSDS